MLKKSFFCRINLIKMQRKNAIGMHWSTYVGEFYNPDHNQIKKKLLTFFEDYKKKQPSSRKGNENFNLYESRYNLHQENNQDLQKVFKFISQNVFTVFQQASKNYILERGAEKKYRVTIKESWFITYENGGFVAPHTHDNCSWSCVYYIQSEKDSNKKNGATFLQAPYSRLKSDIGSESFQYTSESYEPIEGKLVVWPSYIIHGSYPHLGKVKKTVLSANLVIVAVK